MTWIRMPLALLVLLVPLAAGPSAGQGPDGPNVQARWRIAVATAGWDRRDQARDLVVESGRYVARELPGIEWQVAEDTIELPVDLPPWGDPAFDEALAAAIAADDLPADTDVLFVYTAFAPGSRYFGYALRRLRPVGGDRDIWYAVVNLAPERVALGRIAREAAEGGLVEEADARRASDALARLGRRLLAGSRLMRHALILTTVHEFGHFLCPGDRDVKDGIDEGWLRNGKADHNPDDHGADCIMYNAPTLQSIWTKATRAFPDAIRYCDRCKERLGVGG